MILPIKIYRIMSKFLKDQTVIIKATGTKGKVINVLFNPYCPTWITPPNYLVLVDGETEPNVYTKKELENGHK